MDSMRIGIWYDRLVYDPGISGIDLVVQRHLENLHKLDESIQFIFYVNERYVNKMERLFDFKQKNYSIVSIKDNEIPDEFYIDIWLIPRPLQPEIVQLSKPKLLMVCDIIPAIVSPDTALAKRSIDVINAIQRTNTIIWCPSRYVKKYHILTFTKCNPEIIYDMDLPDLHTNDNQDYPELAESFELKKYQYLMYPTLCRKYKQVEMVIDAMKDFPGLELILTRPYPTYQENIKILPPLSYSRLMYLYKNALCTVSASITEGSFPSPIREGLTVDTPGIVYESDVILDRLDEEGILKQESGLLFFNNKDELKQAIKTMIDNRLEIMDKQRIVKNMLAKNTWDEYIRYFYYLLRYWSIIGNK